MRRREFLIGTAVAAGSQPLRAERADQAKLDRIAIMSLCFNPVIKSAAHPDDPKRTLDALDLPDMIAERYGVHRVELQHSHFASTEPSYLEEYRGRLKKAKSQMNQINVEFGALNISAAGSGRSSGDDRPHQEMGRPRRNARLPADHGESGDTRARGPAGRNRHAEDDQCVRQDEEGVHHDGESRRRRRRRPGRTRRSACASSAWRGQRPLPARHSRRGTSSSK